MHVEEDKSEEAGSQKECKVKRSNQKREEVVDGELGLI